jgi:hypothetical protein
MYFGKKLCINFKNLDEVTVDCINDIKRIITEKRSVGYGNVCGISGGNQQITQIEEAINLDKGFQFVLNCESEAHLSQLEDMIKDELNFKYSIVEMFPCAEISVENKMGIHEQIFNEVVTQKRDCGTAIVGSSVYHMVGGSERIEYIASAHIRFDCDISNVNVLINEIISDFADKGIDVNVEFI